MPHNVEWLQEGKVVLSRFEGVIAIDEYPMVSHKYISLFEVGTPPVHVITDLTQLVSYTTNLLQIKDLLPAINHPAMGWQVFYGAPSLAASLIKVFNAVMRTKFIEVRTFEQAIAFLHEKDSAVRLTIAE